MTWINKNTCTHKQNDLLVPGTCFFSVTSAQVILSQTQAVDSHSGCCYNAGVIRELSCPAGALHRFLPGSSNWIPSEFQSAVFAKLRAIHTKDNRRGSCREYQGDMGCPETDVDIGFDNYENRLAKGGWGWVLLD
ncbi:hypothetical protein ElyMa_006792900 [Elysia marginata]|uniref:Uncharacterized protein n=1 Tax=Elysia marginata TaxID=1093978 RepID=A0AAV4J0R0_9GAST|nr:hypothetical protein ElyMa_006792900 [Elysia marginata]